MLEIEQAVIDAGDRVSDSLKRFVSVFHAISNVAPLIGLLGTVLGMRLNFEMMSNHESLVDLKCLLLELAKAASHHGGPDGRHSGTYFGIHVLRSKSDRYLHEIDKLCQRVIDCISAESLARRESDDSNPRRRAA